MERDAFAKYIGQVFDNRYRINKILGIGGMAVVFEATDSVMHRTVAIKMLKDEIAGNPGAVRRFINESKAVSMLSHPNIVAIYDVSVKENLKYIVMEKVEGITLKRYMMQKGALPVKEALLYCRQILAALEHAHSKGITHRDIKPQNVMLLKNGVIKVTDFGIAKLPNAETLTAADKAIGTVFYISPEQASGKKIDQRSDLYSLGVMLYEMVTGELPFNADTPVSVALMQVNSEPRHPRELLHSIPVGLEQIILKAMQKLPEKRFQSARQMNDSIETILEDPNHVFRARQLTRSGQFPIGNESDSEQTRSIDRVTSQKTMKTKTKKRKKKSEPFTMVPIILGIITAFLIVAAVVGVNVLQRLFSTTDTNSTVTIPSFVGDLCTDAYVDGLEKQGYKVKVNYVNSDTVPADTVMDQSPERGEKRKLTPGRPSCDLTLTVSLGTKYAVLEDYVMADPRNAEIRIRALGLNLVCETDTEPSDIVEKGLVTRTLPAAGSTVREGETVVIYVSSGSDVVMVKVPGFVGKDEVTVMRLLTESGLLVGNVTRVWSEEKEAGIVLEQSVKEGEEIPQGLAEIDFVVSKGKDPTPPETEPAPETTKKPKPETEPTPETDEQVETAPPVIAETTQAPETIPNTSWWWLR